MSHKLQALKSLGVQVSTSPDVFIRNSKDEDAVQEIINKLLAHIKFSHCKRVDVDGKKKIKILAVDMEKEKFGQLFRKEVEFLQDTQKECRFSTSSWKILKENLPDDEAFVHMEFAESYTC